MRLNSLTLTYALKSPFMPTTWFQVRRWGIAFFALAILLVQLTLTMPLAVADAIVVPQAMKASTIAEIYIDRGEIRTELEIGAADFPAFLNVLPSVIIEKLEGEFPSESERNRIFLESEWRYEADGETLPGSIVRIEARKRTMRDVVTGEPLPFQPSDAPFVVVVELRHTFAGLPKTLSILPPTKADQRFVNANIGFVAYHSSVAINDFRFLAQRETINLDWNDAWYSEFDRRTLRRHYYAPAAAFLYVEPFEVRKEIIIRAKDLQGWIDLGLVGRDTIKGEDRQDVCAKAAAYLDQQTPIRIDGESVEGILDRVHFISRSLKLSGVVPEGLDIDLNEGLIGAIFVYRIESLPTKVDLEWRLFSERIDSVPCSATDEAGGLPGMLEPDAPLLEWKNYLKNPTTPAFLEVNTPPKRSAFSFSALALIAVVAGIVVWGLQFFRRREDANAGTYANVIALLLVLAAVPLGLVPWAKIQVPTGKPAVVAEQDANEITYSLLHNTYRAFDYRDEGVIYDVLARSAEGDLLKQIYLETQKSLTLANQGGARVKVDQVDLLSCQSTPNEDGGFVADCEWTVEGTVGHWGHVHRRKNQYRAEVEINAKDGQWKISQLTVLDQQM